MKKIISYGISLTVVLTLGFTGCGGESDSNNVEPNNNETTNVITVSNIGNNINGLGYYGDNVIFGNTKITQGIWNITEIDSNDQQISYDIKDTIIQWYKDDRISMILSNGTVQDLGYYGVSENGKILTENWEAVTIQMTYRYLNEITLNNKECMKVTIGENLKTYAMCNVTE